MIKFSCPECGHTMKVPPTAAGKRGKCKQCGGVVQVPKPRQNAELITSPPPMDFDDEPPVPSRHRRTGRTRREVSPVNVEIHQERPVSNSLGIGALVLGVIAMLFSCVPVVNMFVALPLGGIGLILSAVGLVMAITRKGSGIGYPIAAGSINLIAVAVPLAMLALFGAAADSAVTAIDEANKEFERQEAERSRPLMTNAVGATPAPTVSGGEAAESTEAPNTPEKSTTEESSPWANASAVYDGETVKVQITGAKIGKVPLKTFGGETVSEDDFLFFTLEVTNKQATKKMDFRGWKHEAFGDRSATLEDEHGNEYHAGRFSISNPVIGQASFESIYPEKSIGDLLPFEVPIDAAKELRLKLPASAYGEEGIIYLVYDAAEVTR